MNYRKIYDQIISKRQTDKLVKNAINNGVIETHHIVPYCLNGLNTPDNRINLTPREHYICHLLLWKMYPKHLGINFALMSMANNSNKSNKRMFKYNSRLYDKARKALSSKMRLFYAVNPSPLKGKKLVFNLKTQSTEYADKEQMKLPYIVQMKLMWIYNSKTNEETQIPNILEIPAGWCKGRRNTIAISHKDQIMISNPKTFEVKYVAPNTALPKGWKYGKSRPLNLEKRRKYFSKQTRKYQAKAQELFNYFISHDLSFAQLSAKFPEVKEYRSSKYITQLFRRYVSNSMQQIQDKKKKLKALGIKPFEGQWDNSQHFKPRNNVRLHKIKYAMLGKFTADLN